MRGGTVWVRSGVREIPFVIGTRFGSKNYQNSASVFTAPALVFKNDVKEEEKKE